MSMIVWTLVCVVIAVLFSIVDLVEQAQLPDIHTIPEPERLPRLCQLFEALYDGAHPLRNALDKLQTLDTVRIIEGKA
jgi:hypothetical protein